MIKVQHWKLYATHYYDDDDSLEIGLEFKKLQFQYSNYEGMDVPISREILNRSWRPSNDDLFPYFYDGTTMDDYKSALAVESMGCSVTKIEYAQLNGIEKMVCVLILFIQWNHYYMNSYYKWIHSQQTGNRWCRSYFQNFDCCRK